MDYIAFPQWGWRIPVSPELFSFTVFGTEISVRWYGVLIALGFLLAVAYAYKRAPQFELKMDPMIDVVLVCTIMAFVCARLYYVLFSDRASWYFEDPVRILEVWNGGLAIYGGIIGAFVTALWMCPLRKVSTLRMFDIAAPGFLIGQACGRWGNFFNQEAFGANTDLPWGMTGNRIMQSTSTVEGFNPLEPVHPTFLYESLWCILGFVLLHIISKKAYTFKGKLFSLYIMWYGTGRFFIEMLRTDSLYIGQLRVSCLVAAASVVLGAVLYVVFRERENRCPKDLFAAQTAEDVKQDEENNDGEEN